MASETPSQSGPDERTQFAVLLFTDICDSTALKAQHGALEYKKVAELHNALFERLAAEEKLTLIKNTGDGYFARSTSVAAVVRFALRFQHGMRVMAWPGFPITTRIGIHAGEVADITTLGQADVLAPAADLVARVMGLAVGGQILLTRGPFDEARHFVRAHPAVESGEAQALTWLAHGPYLFKGCDDPVEVFEVGASEGAPLVAPPDGEKAKRVIRPGEEETLGWRPASGLEVPGRAEWVLVRKLGDGGFGEVWLARHRTLKDERVFKFCFDAEKVRSLKREVTLFRVLRDHIGSSAGIVAVHDVFFDEPPYFIVMDFIDGPDLSVWASSNLRLDSVPLETRLEIIAQVADALQGAHDAGVIHRDVKPSNILIEEKDGLLKARLTDFGIGQLVSGETPAGITQIGFTQTMMNEDSQTGTRLYLAPELLAGQPATIRSDIYALGVVLYQLAVGAMNRPLTSDWSEDIADPLLREDIQRCVAGDPAKRFAGGAQIAAHLRALPERRTKKEAAERFQERAAHRKKQMRLLSFASAAVAVAAMFFASAYVRERELKLKIAEEGRRAERGETKANAALADLKASAPSLLALAESEAGFQRFDSALQKLDAALAIDPGLNAGWWRRTWLLLGMARYDDAAAAFRTAQQRDPAQHAHDAFLPVLDAVAASPDDATQFPPERTDAIFRHLTKVGANGELNALSKRLTFGATQKQQMVRKRLDEWLGKNVGKVEVQPVGTLFVFNLPKATDTIEPLRGLPIGRLELNGTAVKSLEPLCGMPLTSISLRSTRISDLSPLRGMRLMKFNADLSDISDLTPLAGMPLRTFTAPLAKITDISPLRGAPLEEFYVLTNHIADFSALRGAPLKKVGISSNQCSDLSFLMDSPALNHLRAGENKISDLSPLRGKPLEFLDISANRVADLRPLAGLPLEELNLLYDPITDFAPLLELRQLQKLKIDLKRIKVSLEPLRQHPSLQYIALGVDDPYRPVAEFWADYDAQQATGKK